MKKNLDPSAKIYWQHILKNFIAPTSLPVNQTLTNTFVKKQGYGQQSLQLSDSLCAALTSWSQQHQLSLKVILEGTWALLLSRYNNNEQDIFFGVTQSSLERTPTTETADTPDSDSVPIHREVSPDQPVLPWLKQCQVEERTEQNYRQTSLTDIREWANIPEDIQLFESLLIFEKPPFNSSTQAETAMNVLVEKHPQIPLMMWIQPASSTISLTVVYNQERFSISIINRLLGHFQRLLEGIMAAPQTRLGNLPLLTESEQHQLLVEWNETQVDYPTDVCLHELFEAQVERTPEAVALRFEGQDLTYQALNQRANQLAHYLRHLGVGPETLVGVFTERSLEMVIALYAILKAGGAYVPLDPEYPPERVAFMLEDTQVPVLLTQEHLAAKLPPHQATLLCLDSGWERVAHQPTDNLSHMTTAENLAYVIYTSGSTGRPKGVMNNHGGICNRLLWMQDMYHLTAADHVLQKTPFSFDVSVWEFFWPLLFGARLVVARPGGHKDNAYLVRTIIEEDITTLHFVPPMLQLFLTDRDVEKCRSLKRVICSGEALPYTLQQRFFARLNDVELHNLYGPTEAAVDVTYWVCQADNPRPLVPIGRPVANTQIYILDSQLRPVPIGVPGELHIGGVQVARGYLNRPELTAEKFIPDPFSDQPEARLYKTGDLACFLPDGNAHYLGRIDHQVKIRGFRIELGEIEAILAQHPAVREVVVLAREDAPAEKQLVAYFKPLPGQTVTLSDLRRFLQIKLPDYMIPAAFMAMKAFPLTPNGKVNRRALPPPPLDRPELDKVYVAPRTKLEQLLADKWAKLLGLSKVGVDDDFFELGGNSLKGAVFINQLQAELGEYIYIVALFDAPTVAKFAAYLKHHYVAAVQRVYGPEAGVGQAAEEDGIPSTDRINEAQVAQLRRLVSPLSPPPADPASPKNPQAIFILTTPRSGSTLLRVMLGGHPTLFAPPELDLLQFNTLAERQAALVEGDSFRLSGTIRALMAAENIATEAAQRRMATYEADNLSTKQFYRFLQQQIAPQRLVDKTTYYALDPETLKRAEADFDDPLYIHLTRHPYGTIHSFEEVRADRLYFKEAQDFSSRQIGEMTWLICHQNILDFLANVPPERQLRLQFESLVSQPEATMTRVSEFLGLTPHPDMLQPYQAKAAKMTDGLYGDGASRMLGDVKFHQHQAINREIADRWQMTYTEDFLGDMSWSLAETLGYERPAAPTAPQTPVAPIRRVARTDDEQTKEQNQQQTEAATLLTNLDQLSEEEVNTLLAQLLDEKNE